jgi:hypothetical protein
MKRFAATFALSLASAIASLPSSRLAAQDEPAVDRLELPTRI